MNIDTFEPEIEFLSEHDVQAQRRSFNIYYRFYGLVDQLPEETRQEYLRRHDEANKKWKKDLQSMRLDSPVNGSWLPPGVPETNGPDEELLELIEEIKQVIAGANPGVPVDQ